MLKKKNFLFYLILFIYTIISLNTSALNKDIKGKLIFDEEFKFYDKELITAAKTKEWIKSLKPYTEYYERKILIRKDYLKLIKRFPSNKNIKSADINEEIKKYRKILDSHLIKMNALKKLYKVLSSDEFFDIYIVIYNLKFLNFEKSHDEIIKWFTLCSQNSNNDKKIKILRKNLLEALYFLGYRTYGSYPLYKNKYKDKTNLDLNESKIHNMVCNEFKKRNGFTNNKLK